MKKIAAVLTASMLTLSLLAGCNAETGTQPSDKRLAVYTSFYPLYDFAAKIGGDKIKAVNLVPPGTEPHDWEPAPSDITALEKADVFIYNGAGMEHWVDKVLGTLQNKELIPVEAAAGITLLGGQRDHGESPDPHVWLSPRNAKKEMENIKNAFARADPGHREYYEENYDRYAAELDQLDWECKDALSPFTGGDIVVAHEAFGYLCADYGLNQVPVEGLSPDSEPSPGRMAEIISFVQERNVKVIFFEELVSPKVAETIAKATGTKTDVLNPIEGLTDEQQAGGSDYFSVMRENLAALKAALQ